MNAQYWLYFIVAAVEQDGQWTLESDEDLVPLDFEDCR